MRETPVDHRRQMGQLRSIVIAAIGLGWLTAVAAAAVAVAEPGGTLLDFPIAQFAGGLLIVLWGGLTRAATRVLSVRRSDDENAPAAGGLKREALLDLIVGAVAGFVAFNVAQALKWDQWYQGVAMICSGLFGRLLLEAFDKALPQRLRQWISGGKTREPRP